MRGVMLVVVVLAPPLWKLDMITVKVEVLFFLQLSERLTFDGRTTKKVSECVCVFGCGLSSALWGNKWVRVKWGSKAERGQVASGSTCLVEDCCTSKSSSDALQGILLRSAGKDDERKWCSTTIPLTNQWQRSARGGRRESHQRVLLSVSCV